MTDFTPRFPRFIAMGAAQAKQQLSALQGELSKVFEVPHQPALATPGLQNWRGRNEWVPGYDPTLPPTMVQVKPTEVKSARQEEEMRTEAGSQQPRQDLGRRVETGCREWVAWCSGNSFFTIKNSQGEDPTTCSRREACLMANSRKKEKRRNVDGRDGAMKERRKREDGERSGNRKSKERRTRRKGNGKESTKIGVGESGAEKKASSTGKRKIMVEKEKRRCERKEKEEIVESGEDGRIVFGVVRAASDNVQNRGG